MKIYPAPPITKVDPPTKYADIQEIETQVNSLKQFYLSGRSKCINFRKQQLNQLLNLVTDHEEDLIAANAKDNGTGSYEIYYETRILIREISWCVNNFDRLVADFENVKQHTGFPYNTMVDNYLRREPYGLTYIISAFNFPIMLSLMPLVGSILTGNVTLLKPSELAPHVEALLVQLVPKYLNSKMTVCLPINREVAPKVVSNIKWDHIFFTGSPHTGKLIVKASAEYLPKVTLELGGKNPCFIDGESLSDPLLERAVAKIIGNKILRSGQICILCDYIICDTLTQERIVPIFQKLMKHYFPQGQLNHLESNRVNNLHSFKRLTKMIDTVKNIRPADIVVGGNYESEKTLKIETTVIKNCDPEDDSTELMQHEIFGPILPIVAIDGEKLSTQAQGSTIQKAVKFIQSRDKPLASYIFSDNSENIEFWKDSVSSGGMTVNDIGLHLLLSTKNQLPFGGIGNSGTGSYRGIQNYLNFTHTKAICQAKRLFTKIDSKSEFLRDLIMPPYTESKLKLGQNMIAGPVLENINFGKIFNWGNLFYAGFAASWVWLFMNSVYYDCVFSDFSK